jgi:hypothetical protein
MGCSMAGGGDDGAGVGYGNDAGRTSGELLSSTERREMSSRFAARLCPGA